ncbi:hypothetical protein D3C78_1576990 [compost metagenome]
MLIKLLLSLLLIGLAALFNAASDTIDDFFQSSIFSRLNHSFWNPVISWRNKWKDGDKTKGERFIGSSTVFVFLTDGWHLSKFLHLACIFGLLSINIIWWAGIVAMLIWSIWFEFFYRFFKKEL